MPTVWLFNAACNYRCTEYVYKQALRSKFFEKEKLTILQQLSQELESINLLQFLQNDTQHKHITGLVCAVLCQLRLSPI